jgi:hypothetical protein
MAAANPRSDPVVADARQVMEGEHTEHPFTVCLLLLLMHARARTVVASISRLLATGLDGDVLLTLARLTELDVNPEALAAVVRDIRASQTP